MVAVRPDPVASRLEALRVELTELAATLDRRGQPAAADVALAVAARVGEVAAECETGSAPSPAHLSCPALR